MTRAWALAPNWIGYAFPTPVSAVAVGAVLHRDDFDLNSRLEDLVDDPVVPSAGTAFAGELEPQRLADSVRVLGERTMMNSTTADAIASSSRSCHTRPRPSR